MNFQGLAVIPIPVTNLAWNVDVGKEVHFDPYRAVAAARLTASALHVKGEPTRLIPPYLGFCGGGKQLANVIEDARVRGRIAPGRTPDGTLVDVHHLVDLIGTGNVLVLSRHEPGTVQISRKNVEQDVVHQRRLA